MAATLYDISALAPLLDRGELLLTPNQRLRNRIREAYAAVQGPVGLTPRVYALQEWLDHCWQSLQDRGMEAADRALLNDLQSRILWKEIIEDAGGEDGLFASNRLIQQASEALRNLTLWQIPSSQVARHGDRDDFPLLEWAATFRARLDSLGFVSREMTYEIILEAFQSGTLERLPVLHLESLPDLPPVLTKLLKAAADEVKPCPKAAAPKGRRLRVAAPSADEEIRAAAQWAHQQLQADTANTSIGIIVPDLGTSRDLVERIFTETFEAHYYSPFEPRYTLPFNISTGTPLGKTPLISAALQLLKLPGQPVERYELVKIFNSPFWSDFARESGIRGTGIEALLRYPQFHYSPTRIRKTIQEAAEKLSHGDSDNSSRAFSRRLQQAGSDWRRGPRTAAPAEWVERILQTLEALGWPGSRPLDSVEYQQARQWYQLLEKFASLDLLQSSIDFNNALITLQQLAHATPFQAEVKQSPIQILGALEGEGLQFDHCWVMGMTNRAWPPSPEPNPLLPLSLQRREQMPRSSVEKEIAFAEALTEHYRQCAATVVFSHASQVDDARMLPSPLIDDIPPVELEEVLEGKPLASAVLQYLYRDADRPSLETVNCHHGPELVVEDGQAVRGGTAVLRHQALCPFDAFAQLRLGAAEPEKPEPGLSAADKGSIIHNVMAILWQQWRDQTALLNAMEPDTMLEETVDALLADYRGGNDLGPFYLALEKSRIIELIRSFLDFERKRQAFEVVATEEEQLRDFAGLTFRLRMDRVDRLPDGRHLIIDYKTGVSANVNQWLGERPDEPQMPLYALCYPEPVTGIFFACIRAQDPGYCGVADESVSAWDPRIKPPQKLQKEHRRDDWPALLKEFENRLTKIAEEYRQGYAAVDPKNINTAMRNNAHLLPLNRLCEADFLAFHFGSFS